MIGDIGHQMVIERMNNMDIHSVEHICDNLGVGIIVEDGEITDYEFEEES